MINPVQDNNKRKFRIDRGGGWRYRPTDFPIPERFVNIPTDHYEILDFRIVRSKR
jgi:hypothetical protein